MTDNRISYDLVFSKVQEAAESGRKFWESYHGINSLTPLTPEQEALAAQYGMLVAMQALGEIWGEPKDGWPSKNTASSVLRTKLCVV